VERFYEAVGEVLRRARRARGLTLRDVEERSGTAFKASVLGGYERGERSISLGRFWDLARLYGLPADRLLAEVAEILQPLGRKEVVIDLNRLRLIAEPARGTVAGFAHQIRTRRGDYLSDVVTLRSGDLEPISYELRIRPPTLLRRLDPALRPNNRRDQPSR
jgi:transcriptional regulator with XRE-family HTH domain